MSPRSPRKRSLFPVSALRSGAAGALVATVVLAAAAHAQQAPSPVVYSGSATNDVDVNPAKTVDLVVPDGGTIQDVDVAVTLTSGVGYAREIEISLSHSGVTVVLHHAVHNPQDPPFVSGAIDAVFDDEASASIGQPPVPRTGTADIVIPVQGSVIPAEALSTFDGMDAAGVWTLSMRDPGVWPNDGEDLASWSISLTTTQACTYLLTMGRYNATPPPWNSFTPWNFPGAGTQFTIYDAETYATPVVVRITQASGALVPFHGGGTPPATLDLFGYPIPSSATASAIGFNSNSGTGSMTLELSGLQPSREYEFQGWMKGNSAAPTTWTLTGVGNSYTNTVDGYDASPAIQSTAAGTIEVRYDFVPQWAGSAVECLAFRKTANAAPIADAGADFSVNEGQPGVLLDGTGSSDPDGDPLVYDWQQIAGSTVNLVDATSAQPSFDAPLVALGGETLTFGLTVTANGESSQATVSVTIVNVNHPPIADAGESQSVVEGVAVTLEGQDSFDIDMDPFTYIWVQVGGTPTVVLADANTKNPTFTAPVGGGGGAPGVLFTLEFELTVDDGLPLDEAAPGYTFGNSVDRVTIEITNINNPPEAEAGPDQVKDENALVGLDGTASSDPDKDVLSYSWTQIGTPTVILSDPTSATPSFTSPFVNVGGQDFTFELTVDDGYGGTATDTVTVHVQNVNDPPQAAGAAPTVDVLWPPNHKMVRVGIAGVTDNDDNATITIDSVTQDEPTSGTGDGDTAIDAIIQPDGTVLLRAERAGDGDGRVYRVHFTASDLEGSTSGVVTVVVPKSKKRTAAIDSGQLFDSTN